MEEGEAVATQDPHVHSHTLHSLYNPFHRTSPDSLLRLRGESSQPPPLPQVVSLCLQTSPGLCFSTPAGPDVWVGLHSLAGSRLLMSASQGKARYLCSPLPPPVGAPSSQVGWAELWFPGPLGSVAAFPSSSLGCFHKRKGVGTRVPS